MPSKKTPAPAKLTNFSSQVQQSAKKWSAEQFIVSFLGKDNLAAVKNGETLSFPAFDIWMDKGETYMRHVSRDGKGGAQIQVTPKNAERLYFSACVDNHLLADWPHVSYEQSDGEGGRADVVLWSGSKAGAGKVLAIYENKQASVDGTEYPIEAQRSDALRQAISRIERLWDEDAAKSGKPQPKLGDKVALSVCLFDKDKVNLSSAGEYYNSHAKSLGSSEDRLALAERALESSGMWVESWMFDVKELMERRRDQRLSWLVDKQQSSTSSPVIPLAAKSGSRVEVAGLNKDIAKNRVIYTRLDQMMNYPFLNPAGFSDAQNTRDLIERKAQLLAPSIATSVLSNMVAWKEAGGNQSTGILDEGFSTLGSNDRELHLVETSCFEATSASGEYESVWVCGDVGFANGQHSTLAFLKIQQALAAADTTSIDAFTSSFMESDAFKAAKRDERENLKELLNFAFNTCGCAPGEVKYFFNNIIVQTSIKWARDDKHSWSLSFESNNALSQDDEDLLIHQHRNQIKQALASLSAECAKQGRSTPLVMAKNHQSTLAQKMKRQDAFIQLPDATQWLAADSMFRSKKWGSDDDGWLAPDPKNKNFPKNKKETARLIEALGDSCGLDIPSAAVDSLASDLICYQNVYRAIFSSTKGERETVYKDMKKTLMAGDELSTSILEELKELREEFHHRSEEDAVKSVNEFRDSMVKHLESGVVKGWIETRRSTKIQSVLEDAVERFERGKISREKVLDMLSGEALDAVEQINENGSSPGALHAAAICAKAMAEFKREACAKAALDAAKAGSGSKKKKSGSKFGKFSEVLSQEKYSFWSKETSFDMLVAASLAKAHGSVLAHGEYKIEPEAPDAWPERLERRVKAAAAIALEKIELMTRLANNTDSALVSHYFRHVYGAQRLVKDDAGADLLTAAATEANIPTTLRSFNFYEWMMNSGAPCAPGGATTEESREPCWRDEEAGVASMGRRSRAKPGARRKAKAA